jgi:hypothetical protein
MRVTTRILAGVGAAAALTAVSLPATANAATGAPATTVVTAPHIIVTPWGPYSSTDHRARAAGKVFVTDKVVKVPSWKRWWTWEKKCKFVDGHRFCKPVKVWHKKRVWKFEHHKQFTVQSTLWNFRSSNWHHKRLNCAWETFKVVSSNGRTFTRTYRNCSSHPETFTFKVHDVDRISVNVARGDHHRPFYAFSGWRPVYPMV